ncbi:MAG: folylpolyglutamate synthase/dihydrofolate synthase family protein [Balneolaceae bacterium]|nr:folylpolyglutamate synthase/dihydrofolate synthase family protein [Balneolaceae bacterium]
MSEVITNLQQVEEYLNSIPKFSSKGKAAANFDLSRMVRFCNQMGNPQNNFKSIHVAGTNGKGTVCRMLASVYQESGYRVGLYTSPHLIDIRERFQINAAFIESDELLKFFNSYGEYIRQSNFTYFEITTAIAFWYFSKKEVDLAVLEVGLGGRLDATNVVDPLVSVITSIGLDHTNILGNTISEIAKEKGGIIKPNKPVVIGDLEPEAQTVIENIAKEKSGELLTINLMDTVYQDDSIIIKKNCSQIVIDGKNWKKVDAKNIAVVHRVTDLLNDEYSVSKEQFEQGIENVQKRFQRRAVFEKLSPDYDWYFDGAHNTQSIQELTMHLAEIAPPENWIVILSFMNDKLSTEVAELWNKFGNIYLYAMEGERAAALDEMKSYFPSANVLDSPDKLQSNQFQSELVIFSGSFYFYSVVSNWMGSIASADQIN